VSERDPLKIEASGRALDNIKQKIKATSTDHVIKTLGDG
jgi:hypothetical protein